MISLEDCVRITNKTYRGSGAVGVNAIVPKYIRKIAKKEDAILDYGSGTDAIHTKKLREEGFNVTAYDIGDNYTPGVHDKNALGKKYSIVFASNVLNTHVCKSFLKKTISEIYNCLGDGGVAIMNYPLSPRKSDVTVEEMINILKELTPNVDIVGGSKKAPIFKIEKSE